MNDDIRKTFKALSVPSRMELFRSIDHCHCNLKCKRKTCMTDMSEKIDMPLPNVQRNLRVLEDAGLIEINKVGRTCHCNVTKFGKKVFNFIESSDEPVQ